MKKIKLISIFCLVAFFLLSSLNIYCQTPHKIPTADQMLFNSAQGREFWIAIPPNEDDRQPIGNTWEIAIEIYVTSSKNTTVTLSYPGTGLKLTKKVEAMKITTFSSIKAETSFDWEIRTSDEITDKGICVEADEPISVYVLNHRNVTSDGYLAIPISACGTDYIHLSYYDFHEDLYGGEFRGGGFIIIAAEDNTKCNIKLNGVGAGLAKTLGGHNIGDSWNVTLKKGQTYCVMGDGVTRGKFDLSGSRIMTTKPVGFISFHKRTLIPSYDLYNGRNCMMEMIPPVSAWGKKYVTCEMKRNDHGDFFRLIASESNTKWSCKWYDPITKKLLGNKGGTLTKPGEFFEWNETFVQQSTVNTQEGIRGSSVWIADKPVLLMQYSYSCDWDNAPEFDPFMFLVVPEEQYIPMTVFQTPAEGSGFNTNWFNIVAIGDTNDQSASKLKSITLDNQPLWTMEGGSVLLFNNIPGTNQFWAKIMVQQGPHIIRGETKFGGYIYGFSSADGYGWPAAMAVNKLDQTDTLPPVPTITSLCGDYSIRVTEFRNGKEGDDPKQVDQGLNSIELLETSYNYDLNFPTSFKTYPPLYDYTFELKVINKQKDAYAIYAVFDNAGNFYTDSVRYSADKLELTPSPVKFGNVRLGTSVYKDVVLKNTCDSVVTINELILKNDAVFKLTVGGVQGGSPPISINPGATYSLRVQYTPSVEATTPEYFDIDSIFAITECANFGWEVTGRGVAPQIKVEDWDAGAVIVNNKVCKSIQTSSGLKIENLGSDTLKITEIVGVTAPFELSSPYTPSLPIVIPPNGIIYLIDVCFTPTDTVKTTLDILFKSNAASGDSISRWTGSGIIPGPYMTSKNWNERRVKTLNDSVLIIKNKGNTPIFVTGLNFSTTSPHFKIVSASPDPRSGGGVSLKPESGADEPKEIKIYVQFEPQSEGTFHTTIVPVFDDETITPGSVFGNLDGIGILPKIEVLPYEFLPPILLNETHPDQGFITIKSTSSSADLFIKEIRWATNSPTPNDFQWVTAPQSNFVIQRGKEITVPVTFTSTSVNPKERRRNVEIISDASEGPEVNPLVTTETYVKGYTYEIGIDVTDIDFGRVILCDEPIKTFRISNTSSTTDAIVSEVRLQNGDISNFDVLTDFTTPRTIAPLGFLDVEVQFKPNAVKSYQVEARVISDIDSSQVSIIKGVGYNVTMQFAMQRWDANEQEKHGKQLSPGQVVPFDIGVNSDNWTDAKVTSFEIQIEYKTSWMKYDNFIKASGLPNGWNVTMNEIKVDQTTSRLVIQASGTTPLSQTAVIFKVNFLLLLSEDNSFEPTFASIDLKDRTECIVTSSTPGYVIMITCVRDLRNIIASSNQFALNEIEPNPATNNNVIIRYSVGFKAPTKIEIFNSEGQFIKEVFNYELEPGAYETTLNLSQFNSGVYNVRMSSGNFTAVKKLIITK